MSEKDPTTSPAVSVESPSDKQLAVTLWESLTPWQLTEQVTGGRSVVSLHDVLQRFVPVIDSARAADRATIERLTKACEKEFADVEMLSQTIARLESEQAVEQSKVAQLCQDWADAAALAEDKPC